MAGLSDVFSGWFHKKSSDGRTEAERIAAIRKAAESCPTGRLVMDEAFEKRPNLKIRLREGMDALGTYSVSGWTIFLNPSCSDAQLTTTLVHEARHAAQDEAAVDRADLKSMVMMTRATEADAMAFECAAACEIGGEVKKAFSKGHEALVEAFERADAQKGRDAALSEAFKAWYDHRKYVSHYDRKVFQYARRRQYVLPDKKLTAEQIVQTAVPAKADGTRYLKDDPSFLEGERFCTLTKKALVSGRFAAFFCSDKSLRDFYVEQKDGSVVAQKKSSSRKAAAVTIGSRKGKEI